MALTYDGLAAELARLTALTEAQAATIAVRDAENESLRHELAARDAVIAVVSGVCEQQAEEIKRHQRIAQDLYAALTICRSTLVSVTHRTIPEVDETMSKYREGKVNG